MLQDFPQAVIEFPSRIMSPFQHPFSQNCDFLL